MTVSSPAEQLVGAVLNGRFRLVRLLGEGGMGAVYEADGINGEGKFAVKLLHQEFVKEEQVLSRFFAEAQTTRALQHPNVARIFETASAENGTPYLVMELLVGTPLATYVDQGQALPPPQAINIVYGLLQALKLAHARNVVHRDLKPDNLFLVPDANGVPNVKVLDFGIAKVMDVAGGMGQKTRTGVLLGTPGYMSPEQVKNSKGVDPRSDLWSVAVILYELLTGASPFPGDNEFTRLTSVLSEEPRPIAQVAPSLAHWATFFQRALAKDPANRFQSAEEMAQAVLSSARATSLRPPPASPPASPQVVTPYAATMAQPAVPSGLMPAPAATFVSGAQSAAPSPVQQQSGLMPAPVLSGVEASGILPAPMSAMAAMSAPMSRPSGTLASTPPPPLSVLVPAGAPVGPTAVSGQRPPGTPPVQDHVPSIQVMDAPKPAGVAHWVVAVVAFVAFGLGLSLGIMLR
ncbi:Serine/threonine protein kinase PrkC, regulator of stationary phase [Minicystis rosea]|nr:Serine/threonine protein kinase PrkC, regulator of stationary phase [Minicystis rosea]